MAYIRPKNLRTLSKIEKINLIKEYIAHYEKTLHEQGIAALTTKIPREVFAPVLETIGETLLVHADMMLCDNEEVQVFLEDNPLPPHMAELLPDNFRVFALLLNALKQWVSAESAATDRFLLGGTARQTCREAVTHCIVTSEALDEGVELHHPVRDGRPPILLSKKGHEMVERAAASSSAVAVVSRIFRTLRSRHVVWFWRCLEEPARHLRAGREATIPRCKGREGSGSMPIPLLSCSCTVAYPTSSLPCTAGGPTPASAGHAHPGSCPQLAFGDEFPDSTAQVDYWFGYAANALREMRRSHL